MSSRRVSEPHCLRCLRNRALDRRRALPELRRAAAGTELDRASLD